MNNKYKLNLFDKLPCGNNRFYFLEKIIKFLGNDPKSICNLRISLLFKRYNNNFIKKICVELIGKECEKRIKKEDDYFINLKDELEYFPKTHVILKACECRKLNIIKRLLCYNNFIGNKEFPSLDNFDVNNCIMNVIRKRYYSTRNPDPNFIPWRGKFTPYEFNESDKKIIEMILNYSKVNLLKTFKVPYMHAHYKDYGYTIFHFTVKYNDNPDILNKLIENAKKNNLVSLPQYLNTGCKCTPLDLALKLNKKDFADILIKNGGRKFENTVYGIFENYLTELKLKYCGYTW